MAFRRPQMPEEDPGVIYVSDDDDAGDVNYIIEHPVDDVPEVIRILDSDDEDVNRPDLSSGEEGEFEGDQEDEEESSEEESSEEEVSSFEEEWSDDESPDSGYSTMTDEEDSSESSRDSDDVRPVLPEWLQPHRAAQRAPVLHQRLPEEQVEQPEGGLLPVSPRLEDPAPSSSGVSTSTKRSRESDTEEVSMKRQRREDEDNPEESAPSTSGLRYFPNTISEEDSRDAGRSFQRFPTGRRWTVSSFGLPGPIFIPLPDSSDSD
ncbi:major centromere autoantigen B-like, partial [Lates japonicus]|uniref:Major centromere autoantigen B-like protein n=1 Tax=Lates japonicus TaxID=270547 RepID=A0AAD3M3V1_LATJO|nr:major centromere autoantigen B-like protein [Lates japonicus]